MHTRLDQYFKNTLSIDCSSISITEKKTGKEICNVPGNIYQDNDGQLVLKAYSKESFTSVANFFKNRHKAGELIDMDSYNITATSFSGEIWKGYTHGLSYNSGARGSVVQAKFYKISKTILLPSKGRSLNLIFSPIEHFPAFIGRKIEAVKNAELVTMHGTNEASITTRNIQIDFIKDRSLLGVRCKATKPEYHNEISQTLQWRIHESLQFFLGTRLHILKTEFVADGELKTDLYSKNNDTKQQILPPLSLHSIMDNWDLFSCYLAKCLEENGDHFHPISRHINALLNASGASIEGQLLTLTVAIEGMISEYFNKVKGENNVSSELVKKLLATITESELFSADQYKRVEGLIRTLLNPRMIDILHELQNMGTLEESMVKAWKDTRNKAAHGNLECSKIEKCFKDQREMLVLLYNLIFLIIGYKGPYTDYREIGFPVKMFNNAFQTKDNPPTQ